MSLNDHFTAELRYLRELGSQFAQENPQLARFLGETSNDPDVERLLEGFAFLTARLRYKLEDDLPELTHSLLQMLWPNYLRPIPSATIVRFTPPAGLSTGQCIGRGTPLLSAPVNGIRCQFRTCTDVQLYPFNVDDAASARANEGSTVQLTLSTPGQHPLSALGCDSLQFHLSGDEHNAHTLYLWLAQYLDHITLAVDGQMRRLPASQLAFPGFAPEDAMLPYPRNVFDGYRVLQEYFVFPKRFHFFNVNGLGPHWPHHTTQRLQLTFHFSRVLPGTVRVGVRDFSLFCTPAINLFSHSAEPLELNGRAGQLPLTASLARPDAYEVFSIDRVASHPVELGGAAAGPERVFQPFESFAHEIEHAHGRTALYYRCRLEEPVAGEGLNHRLSFFRADEHLYIGQNETVSVNLTCTNRNLPQALGIGDINAKNEGAAATAGYSNLYPPTRAYRPVLDGQLHWALISNLSLNYLSLLSTEPLKAVIGAYDFTALHDRRLARVARKRLAGIGQAVTEPLDWLLGGLPVRGVRTTLELDQHAFASEGDLYLFSSVLSHFFALYASINAFHQLEVTNITNNERYQWPLRIGIQPLI